MLFSEPKIPQCQRLLRRAHFTQCFSALQRAENSSIYSKKIGLVVNIQFQCSSASRKFLNLVTPDALSQVVLTVSVLFSEPKIPQSIRNEPDDDFELEFQCSSASRKFLNWRRLRENLRSGKSFSALQRAENSSIVTNVPTAPPTMSFSALQRAENSSIVT